ncbi:hypothetical protein [Deinococcus cellulosilyticus]|uniref:Uncharacterized protein n=1 Tax=Deinococcus cellulosilyticus (strain DSM 18568 / NBRC 106333 / KACC 11606 / 5516J-15) TaxID=1223518 RepID=A0A511MYV5_DEIC1|nr:hypothetical protein [Deinococcus cellulosilyticus]GEM45784.1 hypothetical protein DC3_14190 [Deinococcus cellulosilyticus NBRC 106333 = KACC 11606]
MKLRPYWKALWAESRNLPASERLGWLVSGAWTLFWKYESWWLVGWGLALYVVFHAKTWMGQELVSAPLVFVVSLLAHAMKPWRLHDLWGYPIWLMLLVILLGWHAGWDGLDLVLTLLAMGSAGWLSKTIHLSKESRSNKA